MSNNLVQARNYCYRLLKFRPRSEAELKFKLKRKKFDSPVIEETIQYFKKQNLIDDREFARFWMGSRITRPLGLRRLFYELKNKGVNELIIQEVSREFTQNKKQEAQTAKDLAKKKFKLSRSKDRNKAKRSVYNFLFRRGFSSSDIYDAIREL